jgi:hypothetical protein
MVGDLLTRAANALRCFRRLRHYADLIAAALPLGEWAAFLLVPRPTKVTALADRVIRE